MSKKPKEAPFAQPQWPAAKVEMRKIDKIIPYPQNPRTHPQEQVDLIARSMKDNGVTMPILVDEGSVIIAGHGRRLGAIANGYEEYPVVVARGWTEEQKRAVRLQDNASAAMSGWDAELIRGEIAELKTAGYDIKQLGFSDAQIRRWDDVDRLPEDTGAQPTRNPVVKRGQVWVLGEHRLICGDAASVDDVGRVMGASRAHMVFTDPPYGVSYETGEFKMIKNDDKRRDDLYRILVGAMKLMAKHTVPTAAFYVWHASATREDFAQALTAAGLIERQYLIWVKPTFTFGRADYQWQHEPCFYAGKDGQSPAFHGDRGESTVWHAQLTTAKDTAVTIGTGVILLDGKGGSLVVQAKAPKAKKLRQVRVTEGDHVMLSAADQPSGTVWQVDRDTGYEHPTQKPVALARRAIENSSRPGEIVFDGFLGSGTTLIAADATGRRCFGVELDPVYCDVVIRRWEAMTGKKATHEAASAPAAKPGTQVAPRPGKRAGTPAPRPRAASKMGKGGVSAPLPAPQVLPR